MVRRDGPSALAARHRLVGKLLLLLAAIAVSVGLAEGALALFTAHRNLPGTVEMRWFRRGDAVLQQAFVLDPVCGFRPRLGTSLFNEYGTRTNGYALAKPAGKQRVLFLGDSVTFRGRIVDALRAQYGEDRYEYWNAGVESFNACQEVAYYKSYNAAIKPDHVILSFHNNDFESVPVAFKHDGRLVVYSTQAPAGRINPWLYQRSNLYRSLVGLWGFASGGFRTPSDRDIRQTAAALRELKAMLDRDGIRFTVILLPVCKPYPEWTRAEIRSREAALRLFKEEGIRAIDVFPALQDAVARGLTLQETPGDHWHPSAELADDFAQYLRAQDLLRSHGWPPD